MTHFKFILPTIATALSVLLIGATAHAQSPECPPGTVSCNIAGVFKDATQTVDSNDNTYAPDSATASANVGDVIAQGGSATSTAFGNRSDNDNKSSANNTATNTQSNGNISNNVTGGNITGGTQGDQTQTQTGTFAQTQTGGSAAGGTVGNTIGGSAAGGTVGNTIGGSATTNSGDNSSRSNVSGSGNSRSVATGGQGGRSVSTSTATGGKGGSSKSLSTSNSGGNTISGGNSTTTVDASQRTTIKHAANTAASIAMPGYGVQNCFGDTNPSGSFGASIQTFGWGVTANSQKASNVCALTQLMGQRAAVAYLAQMDPNIRKALINNGMAVSVEQVRANEDSRPARAAKLACPTGFALFDRGDKMVCRQGAVPVASHPAPPAGTSCPATHPVFVAGKGCRK